MQREENDWYVEPLFCIERLIEVEREFGNSIYDPCCGQGNIPNTLIKNGYKNVEKGDIINRGHPHETLRLENFLTSKKTKKWDSIITNPPFKDAADIIQESLRVTNHKVCVLLRLAFLESMRRDPLFKLNKLAKVYNFRQRITMYPGCYVGKKRGGFIAMAWFVFDHSWDKSYWLGQRI